MVLLGSTPVLANPSIEPTNNTTIETSVQHYSVRWKKGETKLFEKRNWRTATQEVWLTGQLLVSDDKMDDVELLIAMEDGEYRNARICKNGRFDVVLSAGSKARFVFQKPGHLAKEVLIDASELSADLIGRGEDRKVKFDVILAPENAFPGLAHDGPVGSITFRRGSTALKVDHHEKLVAADRVCKLNK